MTPTLTRDEAAKRFDELPLPSTTDEHWRFTILRGFDPGRDRPRDCPAPARAAAMLDLDVAGRAVVTENGIEIVSAPEGVTFEPLPADYPSKLIPDDDKFALENLARWQHGLLVRVPKGVELEKPLYVQVTSNGGSLYWRMVVVAEEGARFSLIEDLSSAAPDTRRVHERGRRALRRAGREDRVRLAAEPLAGDLALRPPQGVARARLRARLGDRRLRLEARQGLDRERPRRPGRDVARHRRVLRRRRRSTSTTTRSRSTSRPNTESDFAFKGALRENASAVWRGMIRVEEGAQKTNAYQENRNLLLSDTAHADSIPGLEIMANDVRCTHGATLGKVEPRASSST